MTRAEIQNWAADRREIAEMAINDEDADQFIELREDGELVGIASLGHDENGCITLNNLATARSGYGLAMLEKIAELAISEETEVSAMSADSALGFYGKMGWEIEGYPGDNLGVPVTWYREQIARFMSDDREAMLAQAHEEWSEFVEEIGWD